MSYSGFNPSNKKIEKSSKYLGKRKYEPVAAIEADTHKKQRQAKPYLGTSLTQQLWQHSNKDMRLMRELTVIAQAIEPLNSDRPAIEADYSQCHLMQQINLYLAIINKPMLNEPGYCHGITLLWLALMSLKMESLFYQMNELIANCPPDKLLSISHTIELYLKFIQLGQEPYSYGNKVCLQADVALIIGAAKQIFSQKKSFGQLELEQKLSHLSQEDNMLTVAFWWPILNNISGHVVGIYIRQGLYHYFDSNCISGRPKILSSAEDSLNEIRHSYLAQNNYELYPNMQFRVTATRREPSRKFNFSSMPTLFGCRIKQAQKRECQEKLARWRLGVGKM